LHVEDGLHGLRDALRGGSRDGERDVGASALVHGLLQRCAAISKGVFAALRTIQHLTDGIERFREPGGGAASSMVFSASVLPTSNIEASDS
jgi:hypothetical protein